MSRNKVLLLIGFMAATFVGAVLASTLFARVCLTVAFGFTVAIMVQDLVERTQ
jgi:hypothetical protein